MSPASQLWRSVGVHNHRLTHERGVDTVGGVLATVRIHRAWTVAAVAFVALVGAGSFRAAPSVLIDPLHDEFGWSRATISAAVMVNLILYGLTAPFAAALMERFGMRVVVASALDARRRSAAASPCG